MAGRRPSRKGKETAAESSGHSMAGDEDNSPIMITEHGCTLIVQSNTIPETPLQQAVCQFRPCVALSKTLQDAYNMHNTLIQCDHPNILNPIGVWTDPSDDTKAYIAVTSVDTALNCLAKEQLFCVEEGFLHGFTALGFSVFRAIFDAIQYVNSRYEGGATSSISNSPPIPLFPMMLEPNNIFVKTVNGQAHVMLGNFRTNLYDKYVRRNSRRVRQDITREDIEKAHWKEVGHCLKTLLGSSTDYVASRELTELADFLTEGAVTYGTLLWQPGIWDAYTKMQFVREIFFLLDMERTSQTIPFGSTPRGRILRDKSSLGLLEIMKEFSPPLDGNNQEKPIREYNLLDSVIFLRNKVIAHFDDEYPRFSGSKDEIGTSIVTRERYIQKRKDDYMINLARTRKELGWISESPIMRGENDYMAGFSKLMIGGKP